MNREIAREDVPERPKFSVYIDVRLRYYARWLSQFVSDSPDISVGNARTSASAAVRTRDARLRQRLTRPCNYPRAESAQCARAFIHRILLPPLERGDRAASRLENDQK